MIQKLIRKTLMLSTLILWGSSVLAQTPFAWSKTFGGNGSDKGYCIRQTSDGGFIVSGYTDTNNNGDVSGYHGGGDIWVIKLDNSGSLEWQKAYGGPGAEPATTAYTTIIQTSDGGYLVTGESNSSSGDLTANHGSFDLWVFKIDSDGDIEWQQSLGGSLHDGAYATLEEADGGFVLAGHTSSSNGDVTSNKGMIDGWLIKLSSTGELVWQKAIGGTWPDVFTSIQHTSDGGYITAGYTLSNDGDLNGLNSDGFMGYADYWIVKMDDNAAIEWQLVTGGTGKDEAYGIIQTSDGGYVVAGKTESTDGAISESFGEGDWWVAKLSSTGSVEWEKSLGGSERDEVRSIVAAADGSGFYVAGTTKSTDGHLTNNHGGEDVWLVKLDYSGGILFNQCFGGTSNDEGFSVIESSDGGMVVTGRAHSKDGDLTNDTQGDDVWVFKAVDTVTGIEDQFNVRFAVYPNPVVDVLSFSEQLKTIEIYSLSGHLLIQTSDSDQINLSSLTPGAYLLKAESFDGKTTSQKITKN